MTRWRGVRWILAGAALSSVILGCGHDRKIRLRGPLPTIDSVSPTMGPTQGGTSITILGTRFGSGAGVEVGGVTARSVVVVSETEVTASTPSGSPGPADVRVINADGTFATAVGAFVYQGVPPQITSVIPDRGPASGGTAITISGSGFQFGAVVTLAGLPATSVMVTLPSQILAVSPPGTNGPADVTVINPDLLSDTLIGGFTYGTPAPPPTISAIMPSDGPAAGGTFITIVGFNFQPGAVIDLGGAPADSPAFVSPGALTGTSVAHAIGFVDVTVSNPDGQSDVLSAGFEYTGTLITLFRILPRAGDVAGGTPVTVEGAGFTTDTEVDLDGNLLQSKVVLDPFTITGMTPPGAAPGKVDVTATNSIGSDTLVDGFTYTAGPPQIPVINALVPPQGPIASQVNIQGIFFGATPAENLVTFSGIAAPVLSASTTDLVVVVPPRATTGPVNVEVLAVPSNDVDFTVTSPRIRFISPPSGMVGDPVTIIGENFSSNPTSNEIRFHGALAMVVAATPTYLATMVPAGAVSGPVTVMVGGEVTPGVPFCVATPPPPDPTFNTITPASGPAGSSVSITGTDFSPTPSNNFVRFNGVLGAVTLASPTALTVDVPAAATTGPVSLEVEGRSASSTISFTVTSPPPPPPSIMTLYPETGAEGSGVYIEGARFDPDPRNNRVEFNGVPAEVAVGSTSWLLVSVPFSSSGPVTVAVGGQTSGGLPFTITGPSAGSETVDFFGQTLPIPSGSVIYLIDVSGTMAWTFGDYFDRFGMLVTGTRIDLMKDRVIDSIQGLPATVRFNVIAFDCATSLWSAQSVAALDPSKAQAEMWVDALVPLGGTGTAPAVEEALLERTNRTLLLASDGRASCGAQGTAGHLCSILSANDQRVRIHTFAIDTFGEYRIFLEDVAALSGGTFTDIVP